MLTDLLRALPLHRTTIWAERIAQLFPKEFPLEGGVLVHGEVDDVEHFLREQQGYEGTPADYDYKSPTHGTQDYSLRRPIGRHEDGTPLENHPRLWGLTFDGDEVTYVIVHDEDSRYEAMEKHLDEVHFDWINGIITFESMIEGEYESETNRNVESA